MSVGVGVPLAPIHCSALCAVLQVVLVLVRYCDCVYLGNVRVECFRDMYLIYRALRVDIKHLN